MTVTRVDVQFFEGLVECVILSEEVVFLERGPCMRRDKFFGDATEMGETPIALARFEVVALFEIQEVAHDPILHEGAAGAVIPENPLDPHLDPLEI